MSKIFNSPPVELSKEVIGGTAKSGRFRRTIGELFSRRVHIDYISSDVESSQDVLKNFKDRFGIVSLLDPDASEDEIEARTSRAAFAAADEGLVDDNTLVEIRPVLPFDSFSNPALNRQRELVAQTLGKMLTDNYGVPVAIASSHPIIPSDSSDRPVPLDTAWGTIASELDSFAHQHHEEERQIAMLAITSTPYAEQLFSDELAFDRVRLIDHDLITLRYVGDHPRENLLLGPQRSGIVEARSRTTPQD